MNFQGSNVKARQMQGVLNNASKALGLSAGLLLLSTAPAEALIKDGVFSLWLECNNDGVIHTVGSSDPVNGWYYTSDARNDNTDGHFYDIAGIAIRQFEDEVVVAISGNTPLIGTGFDRQGKQVVWGDLFFSDGRQSFNNAMQTGNLYGIRFADTNESGASQLGVYNNVVAKGVGVNNFGHRTYDNYVNVVGEAGSTQANFLGDMALSDLQGNGTYLDGNATGYNVIGQGTKVGDDGFSLLDLGDALLQDLDLNNFAAAGDQTIAFKFKQSALEYQPTVREMADEYGVEWVWDEQGVTPTDKGIVQLDQDVAAAETEVTRITQEHLKPLSKAIETERKTVDGYTAVKALKKAGDSWSDAQKAQAIAQGVIDALAPKKQAWDAMTEAERESAPPEAIWTRKDGEDWAYQQEQVGTLKQQIDAIEAKYSPEELTSAKQTYNQFLKKEVRNHPDPAFRENYAALEAEKKQWGSAKKVQENNRKDLLTEKQDLEDYIENTLAKARQDVLDQRLTESNTLAQAELELETELGGPRTENYGIPSGEVKQHEEVPEPSTLAGVVIALTMGVRAKMKRSRDHHKS
ncbi:MAG: cell envelope integrity protein TolA [Cyanobacteria bacterium P01_G01_bin.54]